EMNDVAYDVEAEPARGKGPGAETRGEGKQDEQAHEAPHEQDLEGEHAPTELAGRHRHEDERANGEDHPGRGAGPPPPRRDRGAGDRPVRAPPAGRPPPPPTPRERAAGPAAPPPPPRAR